MINAIIGFEIGALVTVIIFSIFLAISRAGVLHIIDLDDEAPYLFLELDEKAHSLEKRKYVVMEVKYNKDKSPHE